MIQRRQKVIFAVAVPLALLLAFVAGWLLRGDDGQGTAAQEVRPQSQPPPATDESQESKRPKEIVVIKNNGGKGKLVVLDGQTGQELRTLDQDSHQFGEVTLTPDG